jgi:hypothetical protein
MSIPTRGRYKYIDDTEHAWSIHAVHYLATAGQLPIIPQGNPEQIQPLSPNYKPRHIKLVALAERPGMQKYRTDVVINERDYSKFLNKIVVVDGIEMRCIKYVGEQRVGY